MSTDYDLTIEILNEIRKEIGPKLYIAYQNIYNQVKEIVREAIYNSVEYRAMLPGGAVYHEIGVPDIERRLLVIIDRIIDNINTEISDKGVVGDQLNFNFTINILKADYSDLLSLDEATYETDTNRLGNTSILPWLEWLLISGSDDIVLNYHYVAKQSSYSRTDFGIMAKGGNWTLAPISGNIDDNFLTRAIHKAEPQIYKVIDRELTDAV